MNFTSVDCFTHQENTVDLGVVILHGSDDAEVTALVLEKYFIGIVAIVAIVDSHKNMAGKAG